MKLLALACTLTLAAGVRADEPNHGFKVPPGFKVSLYADDNLATDIYSLTIDAKGRVVVAGKGYVKILVDDHNSGKANRAILFSEVPKSGAQGMYFDEGDLIAVGDRGVRRLTGKDDKCVAVLEPWFTTAGDSEHCLHAVIKGPDGWFYLVGGNSTGITKDFVNTFGSPVKEPQAGVIVRVSPDGKQREIVAHGFRNPYDIAFGPRGDLFTFDSDGERITHLPYYSPCRIFDVAQGMHHGWVNAGWQSSWARPGYWPDNVSRLHEVGRGSPTGVVVYRHRAFPAKYRGGLFALCWTFGRLYHFPLEPDGSSYKTKMETFLETTGDVGFAPTDLAVGPRGDLFISIGGRGTRGGVFRVWYAGDELMQIPPSDPVRAILAAAEPQSSWSRARWVPAAKKLGPLPFEDAVRDGSLPLEERLRAIEILVELFDGLPRGLSKRMLDPVMSSDLGYPPELRARAVWALSRAEYSNRAFRLIAASAMRADVEPRVGRAAWEALATWPGEWPALDLSDVSARSLWDAGLDSTDRRVRAAMLDAAAGFGRESFDSELRVTRGASATLAKMWVAGGRDDLLGSFRELWPEIERLASKRETRFLAHEAVRVLQKSLGDVLADGNPKESIGFIPGGGTSIDPAVRRRIEDAMLQSPLPSDADLAREVARLWSMLAVERPDFPERIAARLADAKLDLEDAIHFLLVLAHLPAARSREATHQTANALLDLPERFARRKARPTDQVPPVLDGMYRRLLQRDPWLEETLIDRVDFGAPGHAALAAHFSDAGRRAAARKITEHIGQLASAEEREQAWTPEIIDLVKCLPMRESLPILAPLADDPRLGDAVLLYFAELGAAPVDLARKGLGSSQSKVVEAAARLLVGQESLIAEDIAPAIRALRRFTNPATDRGVREALIKLLSNRVAQRFDGKEIPAVNAAVTDWFTKAYPKDAERLLGMSGANTAAWMKRIAKVDFAAGDAKRGFTVFQKRNCYRCHGEQRRLGPDLAGAAQRFSLQDLFVAIVDPSKDIAPAFQSTAIVTTSGKIHNGLIVYESPEMTLLQVSPDTTVRIAGSEVQSIQRSNISFMPAGLLDDADDRDLADLYAYLKSLRK
jgi:putative heme-binding domain-containing protein